MNRFQYILATLGLGLLSFGVGALAEIAPGGRSASYFYIAAFIVLIFLSLHVVIKRIENIGYSRKLGILVFIPLINFVIGLICLSLPEGYGEHKTLDTPAKIVLGAGVVTTGLLVIGVLSSSF